MDPTHSNRRIDRRTLIKGAAAAGVTAWTAPVIIDSIASPAAAVTPAPDCFRGFFEFAGGTLVQMTPVNGGGCVPSNCWNNRPAYPDSITLGGSGATSWTFTLAGGSGCVFFNQTRARTTEPNPQCVPPTSGIGTTTVTFPGTPGVGTNVYAEVKLLISCGGVPCTNC